MDEEPRAMMAGGFPQKPSISSERRRELLHKAERAVEWMEKEDIKPHETCLFRRLVETLAGEM